MSEPIKLSYVLTTYNKLPYLKALVTDLVSNCGPGEEVVIIDGASSDGSVEFLRSLYEQGKIHTFVSEKDFGEAHGFNKGTLLARGELIKYVTDDDVFLYDKIRELRDFMLSRPDIDIMGTNGWTIHMRDVVKDGNFVGEDNAAYFNKAMDAYIANGTPFPFVGLGLMIRRSSIAKIGLFSTSAVWVDYEFGLRVTGNKKLVIGWWDLCCYVRVQNSDSNSVKYYAKLVTESRLLDDYYRASSKTTHLSGTWPSVMMRGKQLFVEAYWFIKRPFKQDTSHELLDAVSRNNQVDDTLTVGEKIALITQRSRSLPQRTGEIKLRPRK